MARRWRRGAFPSRKRAELTWDRRHDIGNNEMARTSTYLNFARSTEAAFNFYKSVFGTEFVNGIKRLGDGPVQDDQPELSEADKQPVMIVQLPILGDHLLMGTDAPESPGFQVNQGNNVYVCLDPDTRAEAETLFAALAAGGTVEQPLREAFWGDYFSTVVDRFGVLWMFNYTTPS
jgi:PhnB protein